MKYIYIYIDIFFMSIYFQPLLLRDKLEQSGVDHHLMDPGLPHQPSTVCEDTGM